MKSLFQKGGRAAPGFGITFGMTTAYVTLVILLPLGVLLMSASTFPIEGLLTTVTSPRALAAFRLSFATSAAGAAINAVFGALLAWVLVRYKFPGRSVVDALVDLPFALPTAVAGITLTDLYSETGWLGSVLAPAGVKVAFTQAGIVIALTFIGLPFVVRTVQPVLESLDSDMEEAASILGASRLQTFTRVVFPHIAPALGTGFVLAFARGLGEYGSIVFISGNMPLKTEIVPLLIVTKLEQFDYGGATALAVAMLAASFALLLAVNLLQRRSALRCR